MYHFNVADMDNELLPAEVFPYIALPVPIVPSDLCVPVPVLLLNLTSPSDLHISVATAVNCEAMTMLV